MNRDGKKGIHQVKSINWTQCTCMILWMYRTYHLVLPPHLIGIGTGWATCWWFILLCIQLGTTEDIQLWSCYDAPMVGIVNQLPCNFCELPHLTEMIMLLQPPNFMFFNDFQSESLWYPSADPSLTTPDLWIVKKKLCWQTRDITVHAPSATLGPKGRDDLIWDWLVSWMLT